MPGPGHSIEVKSLQIAGGISKQPAHERFPGQLEDAKNATFAIVDGASKRPGSIWIAHLNNTNPSGGPAFVPNTNAIYKLHAINRSATEKYLVVYGTNILRAFSVDGTEGVVAGLNALNLTPQAATYYSSNSPTADQMRFVSIADYTIIANSTVALGVSVTPTYTVTAEWPTYEQMVSHTPTSLPGSTAINSAGDGSYHRTNNDSAAEPAGYYIYSVTGNTFPTIQFAPITGANSGATPSEWADTTLRGFRIRFEKRQDTFTAGTWTAATKTLVKSNNWASYAFQSGDQIYISAGTGWTPGWFTIAQRVDASTLILASGSGSNGVNVAGGGIGQEYRVHFPGTGGTLPSMHDVAQFIQGQLQGAGAIDALVEWTDTDTVSGYFTITAPWRGSGAKITVVTTNPSHPGGDIADNTAGDLARDNGSLGGYPQAPFNPTNAVLVLGGGSGQRTLPMNQRWTRVAAPGDIDGSIDPTKAPIKMVRQTAPSSGTVTAISVANPTHITTGAPHGLTSGQTVTIAGTNTSATTVGSFVVTVLDTTHFTIPVNVASVTGGTGTWTSNAYFTYDFIPWSNRTSGTDATNPTPDIFKKGMTVADMGFIEQRFVIAAGEHVQTSAASDLFRFYIDDAVNLVDSDPIDAPLSSDRVTIIDRIIRVRDTLFVTTLAGVQHALASQGPLTPSSVTFPRATTMQTLRTPPEVLDPVVYVAAASGGKSQIREAFFVEQSVPTDAADVSAHVSGTAIDAGLLPANLQTLAAHSNSRTLFCLPAPGANTLYLYKSFWSGPRKEQSAWSTWIFDSGVRILDCKVIDDFLYVLVEVNQQFSIEKIPIYEPALGAYPYTIHLDRQIPMASGTGSFGAGVTTWTLPGSLNDTTLNAAVTTTGAQLVLTSAGGGTTVTTPGNFSAVAVTLGRSYTFSIKLTEPFPTDLQARIDYTRTPELGLKMLQQHMNIVHASSGAYDVVIAYELSTSTFSFAPATGFTERAGRFCAWASGDLSRAAITIQSSAATPVTITSYSQRGDWAPREYGP